MNSTSPLWETARFGRGSGSDRHREWKNKGKRMTGKWKEGWHFEKVYLRPWQWALGKRMASKAESTDRRMVHKRGHDKQTWHVKASSLLLWSVGDKGRKNWIILLPDLWIQWSRVKTVPGNNLSSHDLNPLWARAVSHALYPVLHHGDDFKCFTSTLSSICCLFLLSFVYGHS